VIIEIDEVILSHLPENNKCDNSQNDVNDKDLFAGADIYFV
jgi:hypothetical protein